MEHDSACATHDMPAIPAGKCDCADSVLVSVSLREDAIGPPTGPVIKGSKGLRHVTVLDKRLPAYY